MQWKIILALTFFLASLAHAASFKVIHSFGSGKDGAGAWSSVAFDKQGNIYGTTAGGGEHGGGTVFQLTPQPDGNWEESILHSFPSSPDDGVLPFGGPIVDSRGNVFGMTQIGGQQPPFIGMVYELSKGPGGWSEKILHSFGGQGDPTGSPWGSLAFDQAGNLFGTAISVFEFSPVTARWMEKIIHQFLRGKDGYFPQAGLIRDASGSFFGTTRGGGAQGNCTGYDGCGTVYRLQPGNFGTEGMPTRQWRYDVLYRFPGFIGDGQVPSLGPLAMDAQGNLYGTTSQGGTVTCGNAGCGTVFKLNQTQSQPATVWPETILYNFPGDTDGSNPGGGVTLDAAGNVYGTTDNGGSPLCICGLVYKLAPQPDGTWQYTVLQTFHGLDGDMPSANLTIGPDGNLYGTTVFGGQYQGGVVFQIQIAE